MTLSVERFASETTIGRWMQLVGLTVILLAGADYLGFVDVVSTSVYAIVLCSIGAVRWIAERRAK
ncbi:hypothetical protein C453_06104 [Haloferax elongans ATCC BAA-1513]|uniref:Uncharacterized protein n=1 Tax=Haloferax elongans ATCC BAA-1513 TaxID=1230453 RepID=M0HSE3_HALEO|nr:hypothetical protein [Haloferax elongans]ELZ86688.1 hypothetical protein C453_06104 [Haloferax elongans ATCC BAA-1513]